MAPPKTSFRITRGGWFLFVVSTLFTLGAFNAALNTVYLLASLLVALFLVALATPLLSLHGLLCRRAIREPPHAGDPFEVSLWLYSARRTVARLVAVEEPLAAQAGPGHRAARRLALLIPPGGRVRLDCTLPPFQRGVHPLPGLRWSSRFPFGVAEVVVQSEAEGELVVYPARGRLNAQTVSALRPHGTRSGGLSRTGLRGEDFRSLRDYRPGDSRRLIHWRATAHTGRLCVREMERERSAPVMIVLDARLPASLDEAARESARDAMETAISFAAELSRAALEQGCGTTLVGFFPEAKAISVAAGPGATAAINEPLARLAASEEETADALLPAARKAGIAGARQVIAVSPTRETAQGLRSVLKGYRVQYHVAGDAGFAAVFSVARSGRKAAP